MQTITRCLSVALVLSGTCAFAEDTAYEISPVRVADVHGYPEYDNSTKSSDVADDSDEHIAQVNAVFNSPYSSCGCDTGCCGTGGCHDSCCGAASCGCDSCSRVCCCDCGCYDWGFDPCRLFPQHACGLNVYGWVDTGIIANTDDPTSRFNGPYNAVDRSNEWMMNQFYLVAEKGLPCCGHGIGARVDLLYGEDFFLAESIGLEKRDDGSARWNREYYGLAMPQAYVALGNQRLNVQVGHFYSVVGYEGVMSPDNFFYSKSYSYQFAGPFTHWGGQVNWKHNCWTVTAGVHNGWDALDREDDRLGFIGKVRYDTHWGAWTSFAMTTGDESNNSFGLAPNPAFTNRSRYSFLVGMPLTCRLDYVFHHWLGWQDEGAQDGGQANWYGVDQYLYYTINRCWRAGLRFEWFRDEDGTRVGLNRPSNPNMPPFVGDFYSVSLGLNWTPMHNVIIRPEVRADWYDGDAVRQPFNDGTDDTQVMLGLDAIVQF